MGLVVPWAVIVATMVIGVHSGGCGTEPASRDFRAFRHERLPVFLGARVDRNCSETVDLDAMRGATMEELRTDVWERTECPWNGGEALQSWEQRFGDTGQDEDVWLMDGDRVLVSCSPPVFFGRIYVESGASLIFNDRNITFRAREIRIAPGGELWVGSETCPVYSLVQIVMVGNAVIGKPPGSPSKGILCGGLLEMHGKHYAPTWTRLARTARAGSVWLAVVDQTNWEAGQTILLTTTASHDCPPQYADAYCGGLAHENEERVIVAVDMDQKLIQIDSPLKYTHLSGAAFQGEVALLSRRVRVVGEESGDNYGAHMIIWAPGVGRFSGVEAFNLGQLNVVGRYPFHFHMLGDSPRSYVQDCSVVHSNFRAFVIHGTHGMRCSRNVAYNVKGSALYLEDGVEERNVIEYNLIAHVHPLRRPAMFANELQYERFDLQVPSDIAASAFYISNAFNTLRGNVASGGWSGFFFINFKEPLGLSAGSDLGPRNPWHRPALAFQGNTAHSSGFYSSTVGACIYQGGWLRINPRDNYLVFSPGALLRDTLLPTDGTPAAMVWNDTKVWHCGTQALSYGGTNWILDGLEVHGTPVAVAQAGGQGFVMRNALLAGQAGGIGLRLNGTAALLTAVTFRNYKVPVEMSLGGSITLATDIAAENSPYPLSISFVTTNASTRRRPCAFPYDLNGDGYVNSSDLQLFLSLWHAQCHLESACQSQDCNGDGIIDAIDGACLIDSYIIPSKS